MNESQKIAMIVANPCNPDYRVIKQAETLANSGRNVRVYCLRKLHPKSPKYEIINGVEYIRLDWFDANGGLGVILRLFKPLILKFF